MFLKNVPSKVDIQKWRILHGYLLFLNLKKSLQTGHRILGLKTPFSIKIGKQFFHHQIGIYSMSRSTLELIF